LFNLVGIKIHGRQYTRGLCGVNYTEYCKAEVVVARKLTRSGNVSLTSLLSKFGCRFRWDCFGPCCIL